MSEILPSTDLRANVTAFHLAMDQAIGEKPMVPEEKIVRLRASLIAEETLETLVAIFGNRPDLRSVSETLEYVVREATLHVNLSEVADGLADIAYVTEGTFLAFGIDSRGIHAEVQRSNMAKVGGEMNKMGKRLKPPDWTPPDICGVLKKQGWINAV